MSLPLDGIVVLDLTRILAGPYCTMMLGDMGAEVIKVEPPGGDDARAWGPPFVNGESTYFLSVNRNKKSVCLDIKKDLGRQALLDLAGKADVLVENFRPGTMDRLGLGYDDLRTKHERLVYCSISGYGQTGPLREKPGYDAVIQGEAGWMSLTGSPDGPPFKLGASLADIHTGVMAFQGIVLALFDRTRTGRGQRVDVALYDSVVATLCYQGQMYLSTREVPSRLGNRHPSLAPYETFESRDGYVIVGVGNDAMWRKFCEAVSRLDLDEPRYQKNAGRVEHYAELKASLAALFKTAGTSHWVSLLDRAGIPTGRVRSVKDALESPQLEARHMFLEVEHPRAGHLRMVGSPVKMDGASPREPLPPPLLGEQGEAILRDKLGYSQGRIEALKRDGALTS